MRTSDAQCDGGHRPHLRVPARARQLRQAARADGAEQVSRSVGGEGGGQKPAETHTNVPICRKLEVKRARKQSSRPNIFAFSSNVQGFSSVSLFVNEGEGIIL